MRPQRKKGTEGGIGLLGLPASCAVSPLHLGQHVSVTCQCRAEGRYANGPSARLSPSFLLRFELQLLTPPELRVCPRQPGVSVSPKDTQTPFESPETSLRTLSEAEVLSPSIPSTSLLSLCSHKRMQKVATGPSQPSQICQRAPAGRSRHRIHPSSGSTVGSGQILDEAGLLFSFGHHL